MGDDGFYVDAIHFYLEDSALLKSNARSFQYFDLFRRRFEEEPVMLASHLTDTVFMETNWRGLSWGRYQWGVACFYEGNRFASDTIWSEYLDKDMATTLEINAMTNVGVVPSGAQVLLMSHEGQGLTYQATLDANGQVTMNDVYRDSYDLRVHLDGFVDYVSDAPISVWEPTQIEIELQELIMGIDSLYVSSTGWAIWQFSEAVRDNWSPTVRPPRLGGNVRKGVFATRSPFRPNPIGLSSVKLEKMEIDPKYGPILHVSGADLMDGTPIYDIKPYIAYTDSHPEAVSGFATTPAEFLLEVNFPESLLQKVPESQRKSLTDVLAHDPRPQYQDDPDRVYGMAFGGMEVKFKVEERLLTVVEVN